MAPGMKRSLEDLARHVRSREDAGAAHEIATMLLAADPPPASFTAFVDQVPGLAGAMTPALFDLYADAFDVAVARAGILGLPEIEPPKAA